MKREILEIKGCIPSMAEAEEKTLEQLVAKVGRYPADAYEFVRDGLGYAVHRVHGPESPAQVAVMKFLVRRGIDLHELRELYEQGALSKSVTDAIDDAGGFDGLNRHVSGAELCWGLREYALKRWGRLARITLENWNIRETYDFGRIVFAMIDFDFMQKQPNDNVEDFRGVFEFPDAFDQGYEFSFEN